MVLSDLLMLSFILFAIGTLGVLTRRNILIIFMSIEIMLNAVNLVFVAYARHFGTSDGHVLAFFVIALAAAEAGVGLAIVIALFRNKETVDTEHLRMLKW